MDCEVSTAYLCLICYTEPLLSSISLEGERVDADAVFCSFIARGVAPGEIDLSATLEDASMCMRKDTPLQIVVTLFQKLNVPFVLFIGTGKLAGMMTKRDVVRIFHSGFEFTGEIPDPELERYKLRDIRS